MNSGFGFWGLTMQTTAIDYALKGKFDFKFFTNCYANFYKVEGHFKKRVKLHTISNLSAV